MIKNWQQRIPGRAWALPLLIGATGLVYLAGEYALDLPPYGLVFDSETVIAEPAGGSISFSGEYLFLASHPTRRSYDVAFPMCESGTLPEATTVTVTAGGKTILFRRWPQGIGFRLQVEPHTSVTVGIRYRLPAKDHRAGYVTLSANLWPVPLRRATFRLIGSAQSNYHKNGNSSVTFQRFHPRENWQIWWK